MAESIGYYLILLGVNVTLLGILMCAYKIKNHLSAIEENEKNNIHKEKIVQKQIENTDTIKKSLTDSDIEELEMIEESLTDSNYYSFDSFEQEAVASISESPGMLMIKDRLVLHKEKIEHIQEKATV